MQLEKQALGGQSAPRGAVRRRVHVPCTSHGGRCSGGLGAVEAGWDCLPQEHSFHPSLRGLAPSDPVGSQGRGAV